MAKARDQFRQRDVTFWAIAAVVCGALAVLAGNLSALLPDSIATMLHSPRQGGVNLSQLRAQVAVLQQDQSRLRRDNNELSTRLDLAERASGSVTQRVGALEVSVPALLEALPPGAEVDRTAVTASIGEKKPQLQEIPGGAVSQSIGPMPGNQTSSVPQQPLPELPAITLAAPGNAAAEPATEVAEPTPSKPEVTGAAPVKPEVAEVAPAKPEPMVVFAVALGPAVSPDKAARAWKDLSVKLGPLLLGMKPLLAKTGRGGEASLVVGPLTELSQASELCGRVEKVHILCLPVPYSGDPVPE